MHRVAILALMLLAPWTAMGEASEPLALEYADGLLWIKVQVKGLCQPLCFLLDTGAARSAIDCSLAKQLRLRPGPTVVVRGVDGRHLGWWVDNVQASAGDVHLPQRLLATDLSTFSHKCGRQVDGLLGMDALAEHRFEIDYANRMLRVDRPSLLEGAALVMPFRMHSGTPIVAIRVNDCERQWMRVDTGCAVAMQWVCEKPGKVSGRRIATGLADVQVEQCRTSVCIGSANFDSVPTDVHRHEVFAGEKGLLGNGLMSRFNSVIFDMKAGTITFVRGLSRLLAATPYPVNGTPDLASCHPLDY